MPPRGLSSPDAAEREPQRVLVGLAKDRIAPGAVAALRERAADDEEIAHAAGALWFRFGRGAGATKLTPAVLDRAAGSPVTTRNWRTVLAIADRLGP
ncbi:MAG: hypothetical protein R3F20_19475 [Planctomycetota bacterium]